MIRSGHISVFTENSTISHTGPCLLLYNHLQKHAQINDRQIVYEKYFLSLPQLDGLRFRPEYNRFCQYLTAPAILIPLTDAMVEYLEQPFTRLIQLFAEVGRIQACQDNRILSLVEYLLAELVKLLDSQPRLQPEACVPYIVYVLNYIGEHFTEKITLKSIADHFHVGKTKLNADFQKYVQLSVVQYIIQERLKSAQNYLANGLSVEEAAIKSGFYDTAHLVHTFQRNYHVTPKQYKSLL